MADLIIMPSLALIAAQYTFLLFGLDGLANNDWCDPRPRHRVHHGDDVDLRRRHRAERPDRRCSCSSPSSRSSCCSAWWRSYKVYARRHRRLGAPVAVVAHADELRRRQRCSPTGLLAAVFIYWGWDTATSVNEECEDSNTHARPRRRALHASSSSADLRHRGVRRPGGEGCRLPHRTTPTTCSSATGHIVFGSSGSGGVALKLLIIAVLTLVGRELPDDDPARRPHRAVDGDAPGLPAQARRGRPRHLTPAFVDLARSASSRPSGSTLLVLLSHAQRRRRAHVVGRRRRPDDRLLLRPDRASPASSTSAATSSRASRTSSSSGCSRSSAA